MTHYYVYVRKGNHVTYERTCGTKESADNRVAELKKRGQDAWWQTDTYKGAFY